MRTREKSQLRFTYVMKKGLLRNPSSPITETGSHPITQVLGKTSSNQGKTSSKLPRQAACTLRPSQTIPETSNEPRLSPRPSEGSTHGRRSLCDQTKAFRERGFQMMYQKTKALHRLCPFVQHDQHAGILALQPDFVIPTHRRNKQMIGTNS